MNSFGKIFRVSIFGESHGPATGVVIDGVMPGLPLRVEDFTSDIGRRRSGAPGTTARKEEDIPEIMSGTLDGVTTGAPLTILFPNGDCGEEDYERFRTFPRPGHADFAATVKFSGYNDIRGGGHFSGRLTLPLVAAGVVAKRVLDAMIGAYSRGKIRFRDSARLIEVGGEKDPSLWEGMLKAAEAEGDSLGGVVECEVDGIPAGLGEPFWDSVESLISHAVFAIPGVRGIEFGDGFAAAAMKGSEHNDPFDAIPEKHCCHHEGGEEHHCCHGEGHHDGDREHCCHHEGGEEHHCCHGEGGEEHHCCHGEGGEEHHCCHGGGHKGFVHPSKNGAGGINGGITNGNPILFRVAFKPSSSIRKTQRTWDFAAGEFGEMSVESRNDVCFALRTAVVVEAVAAIVLADLIAQA